MKKVTKTNELVVKTKTETFCDDCGEPTVTLKSCCRSTCEICKADLCNNCIGDEEWDTGDYRTVYCKGCWTVGASYREKIAMLEKQIDLETDAWECAGVQLRANKSVGVEG